MRKPLIARVVVVVLVALAGLFSARASFATEMVTANGETIYVAEDGSVSTVPNPVYNATVVYAEGEPSISTAAWFGSTLQFDTTLTGSSRYYDGSNIGIEMTCSAVSDGEWDTHFSVELWRGSTYIGSAALWRHGFSKATWTNVGSGNYRFKFVKAHDGIYVISNDVAMYSW